MYYITIISVHEHYHKENEKTTHGMGENTKHTFYTGSYQEYIKGSISQQERQITQERNEPKMVVDLSQKKIPKWPVNL